MVTKAITVAGTTVSISAALPATYDAAGFAALSYTAIGEITDIGNFGKDYTLVTHNSLSDRKTYKFKASYNQGSLALKLARATLANTDAGQTLAITASGSDASYSFKIENQDLSNDFFTGKVMSFMVNIGSVNSILGAECKVELDSDVVSTT